LVSVGRSTRVEKESWHENYRKEGESPDQVVKHACVGDDTEAKLCERFFTLGFVA